MAAKLTAKQQRIYDYIKDFIAQHGYPPSVREIAEAVNLKSPSTVHFHLKALEEAGVITRSSGKTRSIVLVEDTAPEEKENLVPLVKNVTAASPIWAEQEVEGYVPFDLQGAKGEHYALAIQGDSMIDAGILSGDYVIVHCQNTAENGDIVIALLGDEATCKRYRKKGDHVWLLPENKRYAPIDGRNAVIQGRIIGVVRKYE